MMACPHCRELSVSAWKKYFASIADPFICQLCDKPSSIPSSVESISALIHGFAIFTALIVFAFTIMNYARTGEVSGPSPGTIVACLATFCVVVEAAKVYWVPMMALSTHHVERQKANANRWIATGAIIVILAIFLEQCGF